MALHAPHADAIAQISRKGNAAKPAVIVPGQTTEASLQRRDTMRVVDLFCPGCGAPVSANGDRKFIFCSYCGRQIYLEDTAHSRDPGPSASQRHAQHGPNMELAGKLREARDQLARREDLERQIADTQASLSAAQNAGLGTGGLLIGIIAVSVLLCLIGGGLGILCLCLGIVVLIVIRKNKKQNKEQIIAEMQQKLHTLSQQKEKYMRAGLGINLREKYQTSGALDTLYEFVINERAYTLQQAINLFEDRAQHLRMEKLSRDQLAAQQRQIELMEDHNRRMEARQSESDRDGFSLGKALFIGGLTVQAIRFFRKR